MGTDVLLVCNLIAIDSIARYLTEVILSTLGVGSMAEEYFLTRNCRSCFLRRVEELWFKDLALKEEAVSLLVLKE